MAVKDNVIPKFDNTTAGYKEWRKRIQLYARRMVIQKRVSEIGITVLSTLTGASWRQCEDLELKELEKENGLKQILGRLDAQWQYDEKIEMPEAFETYFYKTMREPGQTMLEYVTNASQNLRELKKYKIELPDEVAGWLLMRRAGLSREQTQLTQTTVGTTTTVEAVEKALYLILGQNHKMFSNRNPNAPTGTNMRRWRRDRIHFVDEDYPWDPNDDAETGYYGYDDEPWEDDDDEWGFWEHDDWEAAAAYYDQTSEAADSTEAGETVFDTEEFDRVYASYTDAKKQLNQLRTSRGFYPVVAVADPQFQLPQAPGGGSPSKGSKGKGKSKGKSKTKKVIKGTPGAGYKGKGNGPKDRAKHFFGTCLRCGEPGHYASSCPNKASPASSPNNSPAKKRVASDMNFVGMALHQILQDPNDWVTSEPDACIQDGGASTFLAGSEYLLRYLKWLEGIEFNVHSLQFKRCTKSFKFGGDGETVSHWMVQLPAKLGGKVGRLQRYIIFGATPLLLGRPILEMLDAVVDFGQKKMSIMQGTWQDIKRGKGGAMLLKLADGARHGSELSNIEFDLVSEEDNHDDVESFTTFLKELKAENRYAELRDVVAPHLPAVQESVNHMDESEDVLVGDLAVIHGTPVQTMSEDKFNKIFNMCTQQSAENRNQVNGQVHLARDGSRPRRKLIWEVYVGRGRVSEEAARLGAITVRFGLQEGWDFSKSSHRKALLRKIDSDDPDEIFFAPRCTLWSPMQNINIKNENDAAELEQLREVDHETHLMMIKKAYWKQVRRGKHAHIEHPAPSRAWKTRAFAHLPGYRVTFDQCEYGATTINDDGEEEPIKKTTSIQTTKEAMARQMSKRCRGDHSHCKLEGTMPGGGSRCREAENYGPMMARHLAKALMADEDVHDQVYAVDDADTGVLRQLATEHGSHAA